MRNKKIFFLSLIVACTFGINSFEAATDFVDENCLYKQKLSDNEIEYIVNDIGISANNAYKNTCFQINPDNNIKYSINEYYINGKHRYLTRVNEENNIEKERINYNVDGSFSYTYYRNEVDNGVYTRKYNDNGTIVRKKNMKYDNGNNVLVSQIDYFDNGNFDKRYQFDSNGHLRSIISYRLDGTKESKQTYKVDEVTYDGDDLDKLEKKSKIYEQTLYYKNGQAKQYKKYDLNNNVIAMQLRTENGQLYKSYVKNKKDITYTRDGKLQRYITYYSNGQMYYDIKYNKQMNKISEYIYDLDGAKKSFTNYHENGQKNVFKEFRKGKLYKITKFDKNGIPTYWKTNDLLNYIDIPQTGWVGDKAGTPNATLTYYENYLPVKKVVYDNKGNLKTKDIFKDGSIFKRFNYQNGQKTSITNYYYNENIKNIILFKNDKVYSTKFYDIDGILTKKQMNGKTEEYSDGVLIKEKE